MRIFAEIVWILLQLLGMMLLLRAILSWLAVSPDSRLARLSREMTEPLLLPVRALLYEMLPSLERCPIDFSFIVVFAVIQILAALLK